MPALGFGQPIPIVCQYEFHFSVTSNYVINMILKTISTKDGQQGPHQNFVIFLFAEINVFVSEQYGILGVFTYLPGNDSNNGAFSSQPNFMSIFSKQCDSLMRVNIFDYKHYIHSVYAKAE